MASGQALRITSILYLLCTACIACEAEHAATLGAPPQGVGNTAPKTEALIVHEWGTYTSLEGSNGRSMDGLHHTEEALPPFVHARSLVNLDQKGVESLPEPVNQKLETPVLYFHTTKAQSVSVTVEFPKGVISEWYPAAHAFSPAVGGLVALSSGSMTWSADLVPGGSMDGPAVSTDSVWAPSRNVDATGLQMGAERERFIFYRGLGRFDVPVHVESQADGTLTFVNESNDEIPSMFILSVGSSGGAVQPIGALAAHGRRTITPKLEVASMETYVRTASDQVQVALEASGLYRDESRAMVDTWSRSYFRTAGMRVLYVAPRAWTDALLPIRIDPQPTELVRTLVGRIEVLTPADEQAIIREIPSAQRGGVGLLVNLFGRFTEAKLRRAVELIDDPQAKAFAASLAEQASNVP